MHKFSVLLVILLITSCNKIETQQTLKQEDLAFIKSLHLLDKDEIIHKFYSQNTKTTAGNFFTNKRIASYWIDKRNSKKNEIHFAFYQDIIKIDTTPFVGATYCPYATITRKDKSTFNVYVDGEKLEIKSFFEDLLFQWKNSIKND